MIPAGLGWGSSSLASFELFSTSAWAPLVSAELSTAGVVSRRQVYGASGIVSRFIDALFVEAFSKVFRRRVNVSEHLEFRHKTPLLPWPRSFQDELFAGSVVGCQCSGDASTGIAGSPVE